MLNLHLSLTQWYFVIAAIFLPINVVDQIVRFRRKAKELADPPSPTHPAAELPRFRLSVRRLIILTLLWPITFLFGYLGAIWDSDPFSITNPRPDRFFRPR